MYSSFIASDAPDFPILLNHDTSARKRWNENGAYSLGYALEQHSRLGNKHSAIKAAISTCIFARFCHCMRQMNDVFVSRC